MLRTIRRPGPQLQPRDIQALERRLGATLPAEYAAFLLRSNGGRPEPDCFPVQDWREGGPIDDAHWLQVLLPEPVGADDILWTLDVMKGRLPPHLLPIGSTGGGDLICLWLEGPARGSVVLWDHEAEHKPPTTKNVHAVAPDFATFLALLQDPPAYE